MDSPLLGFALCSYVASSVGLVLLLSGKESSLFGKWRVALYAGFGLHSLSLLSRVVVCGRAPLATEHESFSFFSWSIVAFFLLLLRRYKAASLGTVLIPMSCALMTVAFFWDRTPVPLTPPLQSQWLPVHGIVSFFGEAVLGLAFASGILYIVQEDRIKGKRVTHLMTQLPSLETLDDINYFSLRLGFPLLTAGIITGSLWAGSAWGSWWSWDPKEVWSLVTWLVYAALLHQRVNVGWRGRKAAVMAVLGFCCVIFTFAGVNLLLPGLHSYSHLQR
jgi:cytochrome c-type biogenesis protein CcsB